MTICIAAVAVNKGKECIVFATDHMVTTNLGSFEHKIAKHAQINHDVVAMLAGNPLIFDDLINVKPESNFEETARQIHENFLKVRNDIIQRQILKPYNLDISVINQILEKPIQNEFTRILLKEIFEFNLDTVILLIGLENGLAKIMEIREDGINNWRRIQFHAIGSGRDQAINTLLFQGHNETEELNAAIYSVFKAKRNAEVMQGVGSDTDLLVLHDAGIKKISVEEIEMLDKIHKEEIRYGKKQESLLKLDFLSEEQKRLK